MYKIKKKLIISFCATQLSLPSRKTWQIIIKIFTPEFSISNYPDVQSAINWGMKYTSKASEVILLLRARSYRYLSLQFESIFPRLAGISQTAIVSPGRYISSADVTFAKALWEPFARPSKRACTPRRIRRVEPSRAEDQPCIAISLRDVSQIYKRFSLGTSSRRVNISCCP